MNRSRNDRRDRDDDSPSDDELGWYDNSQGYDTDDDEDEEYQEFVEREFGGEGQRNTRLRPLYFWAAIAVLVSLCLPFLLMLLQAFSL